MFGLVQLFCLEIFSLTLYSNTSVADRKFLLSCWLLKTAGYRLCTSQTSQLISFLFIYFKLEVYVLEKNLWQFLIALSSLSELSHNSFFMHSRCWATSRSNSNLKSQSASMKTNMHISSKPVWWDIWSLKLHGNESRRSCDQSLFFFSRRFRASLSREPSVSIRKNPLEPRGPRFLI